MNEDIANRIKALRISKRISTEEMADEIGMKGTSYSRIERGGNTTVDRLIRIAEVLGVSPAAFFEDGHHADALSKKADVVTRDEMKRNNAEIMMMVKQELSRFRDEISRKRSRKR